MKGIKRTLALSIALILCVSFLSACNDSQAPPTPVAPVWHSTASNAAVQDSTPVPVSSGAVMEKSNGRLDFLGGQNMFDVFVPAGANATGKNKTQYDEVINSLWRDQVRAYTSGEKTRDEAMEDFKQSVADNLGLLS